jgi:hypothetical protein
MYVVLQLIFNLNLIIFSANKSRMISEQQATMQGTRKYDSLFSRNSITTKNVNKI